jgi:uncharacterized membrane protein YbhN (UPF0104 family)
MSAHAPERQKPSRITNVAKTVISAAIVIASGYFLVGAFYGSWGQLKKIASDESVYLTVLVLSVTYGCAYFLLVAAWHYLLRRTSAIHPPFGTSAYVYCIANMAKYLPGSILHFAGRQLLGARAGWKQGMIARATLVEIGANVIAVSGIIVVTLALSPVNVLDDVVPVTWRLPALAPQYLLIAFLAVTGVAVIVFSRSQFLTRLMGVTWATLLFVLALNVAFFLCNAAMAMALANQVAGPSNIPLQAFGIAYLIAWLAGFAIPGAPGGIGVREGALVLLLSGHPGGEAAGLALGIGMRAVTVLGDILSGAVGYRLGRGMPAAHRT